jgi:hypothetical protein
MTLSLGSILLVSPAYAVGSPKPTTPSNIPSHPAPNASDPTSVTYELIQNTLTAQAAATYAGEWLSPSNQSDIVIYVTGAAAISGVQQLVDAALASSTSSTLAPSSITYNGNATTPLAVLNSEQQSFGDKAPSLIALGIQIQGWAVDVQANKLQVQVTSSGQQATDAITAAAGPNVEIQSLRTPIVAASRTRDTLPWWGADFLNTPGGFICTSGFSLQDVSGVTYSTTAGHCGTGVFKQNGQGYGITIHNYFVNGGYGDVQSISTYPNSATGCIYTGGSSDSYYRCVSSVQSTPMLNQTVCASGANNSSAADTAQCGVIYNTNVTGSYDGNTIHGLVQVHANYYPNDTLGIAMNGDSGGPVYNVLANGTINAQGIIDAVSECIYPVGNSASCNYLYYMPAAWVAFDMAANIMAY